MGRGPAITDVERQRILELFDQDRSLRSIAAATGRCYSAVRTVALDAGRVMREVGYRQTPPPPLRPSVARALALAAMGLSATEIAKMLGVHTETARCYLTAARRALGAADRDEAIRIATERGLIHPEATR